jgi:hypothetical protein
MLIAQRDLTLRARILSVAPLPGARSGSALVRLGDRLLLVQDDALEALWVDPRTHETRRFPLAGTGERLPKHEKPDFEAAFVGPGRAVTLLGSGSALARRRAARIDLDHGTVSLHDCSALFEAVAARLGTLPNIEGAVLRGETLRLFHRGAGPARSALVDLPASVLAGGACEIRSFLPCDLGRAGDVPLHFTDAIPFGSHEIYLAAAEDTPNAVDDGPVAGAAVGLLDGAGARYTLLEDPDGKPTTRKVEGIALDPRTGAAWLVTDPDDPERPAELCAIELQGFG